MSLLLCGNCIGCWSQREYSTGCVCLCTRCSSGTLPITLPGCWRPPLAFLHGRRCVRRVTVTWSYEERVGRLATGLSLLPHPVLGIGCWPTWNSCVRLLHSRANWRVFCFMLLTQGTLCELWNAPSADCRGRTTNHCCYCYCLLLIIVIQQSRFPSHFERNFTRCLLYFIANFRSKLKTVL